MTDYMTFFEFVEMADPPDMGCGNQYIGRSQEIYRRLVLQQMFSEYLIIIATENKNTLAELKKFYFSEKEKIQKILKCDLEEFIFTKRKPNKQYARKKLKCKICKNDYYSSSPIFFLKENEMEGECYKCRMKEYDKKNYSLKRYFEGGELYD